MSTANTQESTAAGTVRLTPTAEDFVWLANFSEIGLFGVGAFAILDATIGMNVMVDNQLDSDARNTMDDDGRRGTGPARPAHEGA